MNREIYIAFISEKIKQEFEALKEGKFQDKQLYNFISRAIRDLKINPTCGIKISKNLWPKEYVKNQRFLSMLRNPLDF